MTQVKTTFNLNGAEVPALICSRGIGNSVVINLHGLDVSKEVNITDMGRLVSLIIVVSFYCFYCF